MFQQPSYFKVTFALRRGSLIEIQDSQGKVHNGIVQIIEVVDVPKSVIFAIANSFLITMNVEKEGVRRFHAYLD